MTNEERIIEMLSAMQSDISGLKQDVQGLKEGQSKLEAAQTRQEIKTDTIAEELQQTKEILVRFENEYKQDRGGLFDGLDLLKDKANRIESKVDIIESRLDNHELHILALERPLIHKL